MIRVLFQLIAILFLSAIVGQQLVLPALNTTLFEKQMDWTIQFLTKGTIDLLSQELNKITENDRAARLKDFQQDFGFDIALLDLSHFDDQQKSRLFSGELITNVETQSVYKLLGDESQVLAFEYIETATDHITSEAQWRIMGTMNMLKLQLESVPESLWLKEVSELSKQFQFKVEVRTIEQLDLNQKQQSRLLKQQTVWHESESSKELEFPFEKAFSRIKQSDKVLVVGPIAQPIVDKVIPVILWYYFILSVVMLLPLALWIIPTWRSLKYLSNASAGFGKGDFSLRSSVVKGSNINNFVRVFNNMADKIQGLVTVNKSLVNAVSHELRTPLSRIEFDLELARDSNNKQERAKLHDRIETSVDELKLLVNEMLLYAKFDQEKPTLNFEHVDLNQWLHNGLESWQVTESKIPLTLNAINVSQFASLDRYYMNRVVSNLTRNALKYANSKVTISFGGQDQVSFIEIEDDGPGIPQEDRERVFDAFVRLDKSRNRDSGGSGLGLAIVKQILDWHSGSVTITDSSLGGAKFTVTWSNQPTEIKV